MNNMALNPAVITESNDMALNPAVITESNDQPRSGVRSRPRFEWTWILLVSVFLGVSGGVRYWRDWQFRNLSKESEKPPFPLKEFPKILGDWHEVEGLETKLDPEIARIAGTSDHVIRTYSNERTGESVVVMILYGLAQLISAHTPAVCYPSAGFKNVPPTRVVDVPVPGPTSKVRFREDYFVKYAGGSAVHEHVYHSFRNAGEWGPDMQSRWKSFRHNPGMFKVQIQRRDSGEAKQDDSGALVFLGKIVEEIDRRQAASKPSG
jgi:hypothetical protein